VIPSRQGFFPIKLLNLRFSSSCLKPHRARDRTPLADDAWIVCTVQRGTLVARAGRSFDATDVRLVGYFNPEHA
jgi:hypothetical protein